MPNKEQSSENPFPFPTPMPSPLIALSSDGRGRTFRFIANAGFPALTQLSFRLRFQRKFGMVAA